MWHKQQTLRYTQREDDLRMVAKAIDLLGKQQVAEAIEVLMGYRNYLQDAQRPVLEDYDPRKAQMEAMR